MQCSFEGMHDIMLYCIHQKYFTSLQSLPIMPCQAVCSVLRTPIASIDHLKVQLPDPDALKVRWSLECFNGQFLFPVFMNTHIFVTTMFK